MHVGTLCLWCPYSSDNWKVDWFMSMVSWIIMSLLNNFYEWFMSYLLKSATPAFVAGASMLDFEWDNA